MQSEFHSGAAPRTNLRIALKHVKKASNTVLIASSKASSDKTSDNTNVNFPSKVNFPLAALVITPIFWGTYGPLIRKLYSLQFAPPELLFNVFVAAASSMTLNAVPFVVSSFQTSNERPAEITPTGISPVRWAGLELGGYLFLAGTIQIFATRFTTIGILLITHIGI